MTRANYYRSGPQRKDPAVIDDLLGSIVEQAGASRDLGISDLVATWDDVVSERWQGRYDAVDLLRRISDRYGPDLVRAIRFRVQGDDRGGKP